MADFNFLDLAAEEKQGVTLLLTGSETMPEEYVNTLMEIVKEEFPVKPIEVVDDSLVELACVSMYDLHEISCEECELDPEDYNFCAHTVIRMSDTHMIIIARIDSAYEDDSEEDEDQDDADNWD